MCISVMRFCGLREVTLCHGDQNFFIIPHAMEEKYGILMMDQAASDVATSSAYLSERK